MYRWVGIVMVFVCMMLRTSAQNFSVIEVELSPGQTAHIVPLYQDFDFFSELVSGNSRGEFSICARAWALMNGAFGIEIPGDPQFQYNRRWNATANQISNRIINITEDTLIESADLLPGEDILVCIVPAAPASAGMTASAYEELYGLAVGDVIIVAMGNLQGGWQEKVASIVAHEYHHTVRSVATRSSSRRTLLDILVTEGMAVRFAEIVVPRYRDPVYNGLTRNEESQLWAVMQPQLVSTNANLQSQYLLGGEDDVPTNAGYTIGYHIVQGFLGENRNMSVEDWTILDSQTVYDASDYNP